MATESTLPNLPPVQTAIVQDSDGRPKVDRGVPLPTLKPGTVLIKTAAVALNPSDFKMGKAFPTPGAIVGVDFSGRVLAVHPSTTTNLGVGDLVCGIVHGSNPADLSSGAFAEFVVAPASFVLKVPPALSHIHACGLGCALLTSAVALWGADALALTVSPEEPASDSEGAKRPVLVYGGSTASGTMVVQLLKLCGLDPVATASLPNFDLVKSFGASDVFDSCRGFPPAGPTPLGKDINRHTTGRLRHALDCIADQASVACCYAALGRPGGRYASLESTDPAWHSRAVVKDYLVMSLEGLGKEVRLGGEYRREANAELCALVVRMFGTFQKLLDDGRLKVHPVEIGGHGWEAVLGGINVLKSGSVSSKKLVAVLDEVPDLKEG